MSKVFLFFLFTFFVLSKPISSSASATKDSKKQACEEATKQAQKEALELSGINIFSSFKVKKVLSDKKIEKIISHSVQSSYGLVKTKSKKESVSFNEDTNQITCKVDGVFEVDTSNLEHQMKALKIKYDNMHKEEEQKKKDLERKIKILQRYKKLMSEMSKEHTFDYNNSYNCGNKIGLSECKQETKKDIKVFFKKKLAKKYHINSSDITISEIKYNKKLEIKSGSHFNISYNGKLSARAIKVKNPYNENIIDEKLDTNKEKEKTINVQVSDNDTLGELVGNEKSNKYIYIYYDFNKISRNLFLTYKMAVFHKDYLLKASLGTGKYNSFQYNLISFGLSHNVFKNVFFDLDVVTPYTKNVTGKSFMEISVNVEKQIKDFLLGVGVKYSGKDGLDKAILVLSIGRGF